MLMTTRRAFINASFMAAGAFAAGAPRFAAAAGAPDATTSISCFRGNAMRNLGGTGPLSATPTLR